MELKEHQLHHKREFKVRQTDFARGWRRSADILVRSNAPMHDGSENSSSIRALHLAADKNFRAPPRLEGLFSLCACDKLGLWLAQ
jgi:hypothetical protein